MNTIVKFTYKTLTDKVVGRVIEMGGCFLNTES
jgi:hypothetical protein